MKYTTNYHLFGGDFKRYIFKTFIVLIFVISISNLSDGAKRKEGGTLTLAERIEKLTEMSMRKPVIRLNGDKFKQFIGVKSFPRNYSFVIMMTALSPHRQCGVCRMAMDEYSIVANSFRYSPYTNKLFFGMVDFDEGSDVFQMLGIGSAPVFLYFSEKGKPKSPEVLDIERKGYAAETIGKWVSDVSSIPIRVIRPPNYSTTLVILALMMATASLLYIKRNNLDFLYNRNSWAFISLSIVFAMTSGQMWNHIRGPPLMTRNRAGQGMTYIHNSSSAQFVLETYIVIALNAAIAVGVILMNHAMKSKGDHRKRKIQAIFGFALMVLFFSLLLSIFRSKAHGYPYSFLIK
ncbi:oligosaccharide transferase gamma subunit [Brevipalpus obovatus]|uniref:oligosaccharide transferase gamma subunit n=1 Tax=Brevipalpus obovatus TaxID=246614 RepID=UPI003D9DDEFC